MDRRDLGACEAESERSVSYWIVEPFRRIFRLGLSWWLGISKWHVAAGENKPYVRDIVAFVNRGGYHTVCEVGCGLGDIIGHISALSRYGFDSESGVVRGARLLAVLTRQRVLYQSLELTPNNIPFIQADVWILVNWIHEVSPASLQPILQTIFKARLNPGGCIIIDSVPMGEGRYQHDPLILMGNAPCSVVTLGSGYAFSRTVYVIQKSKRMDAPR